MNYYCYFMIHVACKITFQIIIAKPSPASYRYNHVACLSKGNCILIIIYITVSNVYICRLGPKESSVFFQVMPSFSFLEEFSVIRAKYKTAFSDLMHAAARTTGTDVRQSYKSCTCTCICCIILYIGW